MLFQIGVSIIAFSLQISSTFAVNPKRGLCFAESSNRADIARVKNSNISWVYNWGTTPPSEFSGDGLTYIPMQWGSSGIASFAATVAAQGAKTVLTFNEPDLVSQSNLTPAAAAALWKQYLQPMAASGVRLGSPAITNGPSGTPWMSSFLTACSGCSVGFIAIHWYGTGIGNFYDYIWSVHGQFPGYKIWVTEFANTSTDDAVVLDFMQQTIVYLDSLDWIESYSWFAFYRQESTSHNSLLDANGNLNALGHAYAGI